MVILIRCNDIVSDPRAMKYLRFMESEGIEHKRIAWDRDGNAPAREDAVYYDRRAGFNVGGMTAARNRLGWMNFIIKTLRKMKPGEVALHACDLDAAFPAVLYKMFFNRKAKIVFDIFDWVSATLYNAGKVYLWAFKFMERVCVRHSDYFIICEPERIEQIPFTIPHEKVSVLPNIPYFKSDFTLEIKQGYAFGNGLKTIAYVGGFARERCLDEIIDIAEEGKINLLIAGYGTASIEARLNALRERDNIKYFGKVKYEEGLQIMYNADMVYAMYSVKNPNHIYAAPNKYYESMMLGRPIFTTKGTIVERKVKELGIGYVSGENKEEIYSVIDSAELEEMKKKGEAAHQLWEEKYCDYTDHFMRTEYREMVLG